MSLSVILSLSVLFMYSLNFIPQGLMIVLLPHHTRLGLFDFNVSSHNTAFWCSSTLTFRGRFVPHLYSLSQKHGMEYSSPRESKCEHCQWILFWCCMELSEFLFQVFFLYNDTVANFLIMLLTSVFNHGSWYYVYRVVILKVVSNADHLLACVLVITFEFGLIL